MSKAKLLDLALLAVCLFGTLGFALGFAKWFDRWVYLPSFPNALDSAFLTFSAVYLGGRVLGERTFYKQNRREKIAGTR